METTYVPLLYEVWRSQILIFSQFHCSINFTPYESGIPGLLVLKLVLQ